LRNISTAFYFAPSMKQNIKILDSHEQQIFDGLNIRLIGKDQQDCYERLIDKQHYLKSAQLVGEQLRYVVEYAGECWRSSAFPRHSLQGERLDAIGKN